MRDGEFYITPYSLITKAFDQRKIVRLGENYGT